MAEHFSRPRPTHQLSDPVSSSAHPSATFTNPQPSPSYPLSQQPPHHAPPRPVGGPTASNGTYLNPRSCVTCRKRKVKCNKEYPCSNCLRGNTECKFPAPGRAPRRPRKPPDSELLTRLRKLEGVVQSLGVQTDDDPISPTNPNREHQSGESASLGSNQHSPTQDGNHRSSSVDGNFGRLVLDEGKSRFISHSFWANLSEEVEDVKGILQQSSDDEDHSPDPSMPPSPTSHQGFVFGHASSPEEVHSSHPSANCIDIYWRVHQENVDPLIKMLHMPTVKKELDAVKHNPASANKGFEALMYAIYFASVTSMTAKETDSILGEDRGTLLSRYRQSTERALARAGFMTTEEIVVLQALVLFLIALRRHEDPRLLWTMTGLLARLAVSLGLHRDPTQFGLSPFDTEVRRRLFWTICNVDIRFSEDFGADPIIFHQSYDTSFPLHISDTDFQPDMGPMEDSEGINEMTFTIVRYKISETMRRIMQDPLNHAKSPMKAQQSSISEKEHWIDECHQWLEDKFLRFCDINKPLHWVICTVARLILAKLWLTIYQPYQRLDGGESLPRETRDRLFITSLESIEYALLLETEVRTVKWGWMFKSYSAWHALAFLLSELCHRTKGPTVLRAWRAVDAVIVVWGSRVPTHKRDNLWRPLRKLMAKARAARDRELAPDNNLAHMQPGVDGRVHSTPSSASPPFFPEELQASWPKEEVSQCNAKDKSADKGDGPLGSAGASGSGRTPSAGLSLASSNFSAIPWPAGSTADEDAAMPDASSFFTSQAQTSREFQWPVDSLTNPFVNELLLSDLDPGDQATDTDSPKVANGLFTGRDNDTSPPVHFPSGPPGFSLNHSATMPTNALSSSVIGGAGAGQADMRGQMPAAMSQQASADPQSRRATTGGMIGEDDPMVSGISNDAVGRLPDWDDWNDWEQTVRGFELETSGDGLMGAHPSVGGSVSAKGPNGPVTPGAALPAGLPGRRPIVGGGWF